MINNNEILKKINNPNDINDLSRDELKFLCSEIRDVLIETTIKNGGHLASNLGVVELTVALCHAFDFDNDKIVFDVGHQSYTYKLLTGRYNEFHKLREKDGLSGFPKMSESKYDHFNTGHSSTSISSAFGYAIAAKNQGIKRQNIALIGDGALTGGMAFEALNNVGDSKEDVLVILNDNEMSICQNVGGFSNHFAKMRSKKSYMKANSKTKQIVEKIPIIGKWISNLVHKIKGMILYFVTNGAIFEELGFTYIGPVDGHDLNDLIHVLNDSKKVVGPKIIHVITKKGKGYKVAEENPEKYHGVSKQKKNENIESTKNISNIVGDALIDVTDKNKNVMVVCPATTVGNGLREYSKKHPDNFLDVGIAEQHAVTLAAGLACSNVLPIVAIYSTFLQRAYDQILHDVCLMNLNVVFCVDRAGIIGGDGATHQGIYDVSFLSHLPNITILSPIREKDFTKMIDYALYKIDGPSIIRYPKGSTVEYEGDNEEFLLPYQVKEGKDICIMTYSRLLENAIKVSEMFHKESIDVSVIDLRCIKPLSKEYLQGVINNHKYIIVLEDSLNKGSVYESINDFTKSDKIYKINLGEKYNLNGSIKEIHSEIGLDADGIFKYIMEITNE